ncbi:PepSY-associated TM helix domain-containing protein [Saccharicrinis fermentans]|uniref:Putative iron-regulated membrane protein n=1 Tax=Saccharicrinis fermentans DSM 9555 = JCM 21142 TaxID=869213 RepID=W7YH30_9BACT|nr:PepSY-associated TM helix domain-containing protein [Saccharicrinis fermentans]GAF01909.1 putative iron-regulated membrane protein [Saccharicrinis fermentans DSM 9555 = JCM 21142]
MMISKELWTKVHLWLGLISAPLVFFVCITGTIFVFSDEIIDLSAGEARYVNEVKESRLSTEKLLDIVREAFPKRMQPSYMVCYKDPHRSIRFNSYSKTEGLHMVYIDQYTGEILKDDATIYFFYVLAHLHHSLLWHDGGPWIIDIVSILFLIALISGIVLWWPQKWDKKHKKASFTIKWSASLKRINLDLHKVYGFYGAGIAFILVITGLLIAFKPFAAFTKNLFGGDAALEMKSLMVQAPKDTISSQASIDVAIQDAFETYPHKNQLQLLTFRMDQWDYLLIKMSNKIGIKSAMDGVYVAYDKYTGEKFDLPRAFRINKKVEDVYWSLHLGNYMGLFGKIVTFLGGLIASSLPVTGFIIWLNKRKKINKNKRVFSEL